MIPRPRHYRDLTDRMEKMRRGSSVRADGANITHDSSGLKLVVDQNKDFGFWTKILDESDTPGVYEHIQQDVRERPAYDDVKDAVHIFQDANPAIKSFYKGEELIYPLVEVNGEVGLGTDGQGNNLTYDGDDSRRYLYVWCWLGWDANGDKVFLFDHATVDPNEIVPTVAAFLYTFQDRDPAMPSFIAQYRYSFPVENDPPFSCDPATGDTLQDEDGNYILCEPGDYFVVTDDTFLFPNITTGCRGFATYDDGFDTWDCTFSQQVSILATAFINNAGSGSPGQADPTAGMPGDIANVTINGFRIMGFSPFNGSPTQYNAQDDEYESPTSAYNAYALMGMHGDRVLLAFDAEDEQWVIIQVQHHKQKLLIADTLRVKQDGKTLEAKSVQSMIQYNNDPDYTDQLVGTKCDGT